MGQFPFGRVGAERHAHIEKDRLGHGTEQVATIPRAPFPTFEQNIRYLAEKEPVGRHDRAGIEPYPRMRTADMFDFLLVGIVEPATEQAPPMFGLGIPKPRGGGRVGKRLPEIRMLRNVRIEPIQQIREMLFESWLESL